jgi:MOSC domain-containing protein YiiM
MIVALFLFRDNLELEGGGDPFSERMKTKGRLQAIWIAPEKGAPMVSLTEVRAVAGQGLFGDRNFSRGTHGAPDKNLTLIEAEKIADFVRATDLPFSAADSRRNLVTEGIELNPLVSHEFYIGAIKIRAVELCEPCSLLAKRTHRQVLWGLLHRGGLRCEILTDGIIRVGDAVGP